MKQAQGIVVCSVTDHLSVPEFVHITELQCPRPTGRWNITSRAMQWPRVGATTNELDDRLIFCGKEVRHFDAALRESRTKSQEKLLETLGATKDGPVGNIDDFTVLTHGLSGIVEPSRVRSVAIVRVITLLSDSRIVLCTSHSGIPSARMLLSSRVQRHTM